MLSNKTLKIMEQMQKLSAEWEVLFQELAVEIQLSQPRGMKMNWDSLQELLKEKIEPEEPTNAQHL